MLVTVFSVSDFLFCSCPSIETPREALDQKGMLEAQLAAAMPGSRRDAIPNVAMKGLQLHGIVSHLFRVHHEDSEVILVEAGIDCVSMLNGAEKERSGDERYQRKRNLATEKDLLQTSTARGRRGKVRALLSGC